MLGVDSNLPNKSGYAPGSSSSATTLKTGGGGPVEVETAQDALARKTQAPTGGVQTARISYGTPNATPPGQTMDQVLQEALEQVLGGSQPKTQMTTLPDQVPIGGMQKPRLGKRPGGYTTDIPARPGYEAPAEVAPVERRAAATGKSAKLADTSAGTDSLEELLNAIHGEDSPLTINPEGHGTKPFFTAKEVSGMQSKTGQMLPSQDLADEAASLRRMKGSRDAGSALFPDLAPAERGGLVKKLAPGPSQTPLEAEARINAAAQKAKGVDIPSILLAMLTGGGGALASRPTTPDYSQGLPE